MTPNKQKIKSDWTDKLRSNKLNDYFITWWHKNATAFNKMLCE